MDNLEAKIELAEKYLTKNLSEKELEGFKNQLTNDDELVDITSELKIILQGLKYAERLKLKKRLEKIDTQLPEIKSKSKPKRILNNSKIMSVAATVLVILGLIYFLGPEEFNGNNLYPDYFKPYTTLLNAVERSATENLTTEQKAYYYYEAEDYREAINHFNAMENLLNDNFALFYLALSYMGAEDIQKAIPILENVANNEPALDLQSKWYLSLAYLHENELGKSKKLLTYLSKTGSSYSKDSEKLLMQFQK